MTRSETRVMDVWDVGPTGDAEVANVPDATQIVSFLSDGRHVTTSGQDGSLHILDLVTGEEAHRPIGWFDPPQGLFSDYEFSPDGSSIAVIETGGAGIPREGLTIRDVETGAELLASGPPLDFGWSPDGRFAASVQPRSVTIVDSTGRQVGHLEGSFTEGLSFGPRGLIAVARYDDPVVQIWDRARGEIIADLPTPSDFEVMTFDTDGSRFAIGTADTTIWDARTGRLLLTLPSSQGLPNDLAFSADGSRLAEGDADGTVRVFDTGSAEEVLVLRAQDTVDQVAFSPDGSMLATLGDGILRIWALDIDDLLEIAHGEVTRSLTDEECRQYLHVEACPAAPSDR